MKKPVHPATLADWTGYLYLGRGTNSAKWHPKDKETDERKTQASSGRHIDSPDGGRFRRMRHGTHTHPNFGGLNPIGAHGYCHSLPRSHSTGDTRAHADPNA